MIDDTHEAAPTRRGLEETTMASFNTDPKDVVMHAHGLALAEWSAWWLLWRYASDQELMNKDIDAGANRAEQQRPPTDRQLAAARKVVAHAETVLGWARK